MKSSEYMEASAKQLAAETQRLRKIMAQEIQKTGWTKKAGKISRRLQMVEGIGHYKFFDTKEFDDEMRKLRPKEAKIKRSRINDKRLSRNARK